MKYTYLIIDFAAFIVPFIFSFHPKIKFYKEFKYFLPANLSVALLFILWDTLFTDLKVWRFNSDYITGFYFGNLPIEEVLFFIFIPFSCLFTYHCFKKLINIDPRLNYDKKVSLILICILSLIGIYFIDRKYTASTFISLSIVLYFFQFIFKLEWLRTFYFTYMILLFPFLIVNGILTGSGLENPIVLYDNSENLNLRLMTIPVEDIFYGMCLILLNVLLYETFSNRIRHSKV